MVHSCEDSCGIGYGSLHCICKYCHGKIYIQCMRNRDQITKDLLYRFDLMMLNNDQYLVLVDLTKKSAEIGLFNQIFNVDSPFAVSCETCDAKMKAAASIASINDNPTTSTADQNQNRTPKQLRAPEPSVPKPIRPPTSKSDGVDHEPLRIYVSQFHPETEIIDLVNHIGLKTSLIEKEHYTITKLTKKHRKFPLSFVSFMIVANTQDAYDKILASDVWDGFVASPFEPRDKSTKGRKKNAGKSEEKPVQTQPEHPKKSKKTNKNQPDEPKKNHHSEHRTSNKNDEKQLKKKSKEKKEKSVPTEQKKSSNPPNSDFLELIKSTLDQNQIMLQLILRQQPPQQPPQTSTSVQCNCRH